MHELAHLLETMLRFLLVPSAKAAILAVIALVVTLAFRRWMAPRWRHMLFLLVFVRLVLPDVGAWDWSANRWTQIAAPEPVAVARSSALPTAVTPTEPQTAPASSLAKLPEPPSYSGSPATPPPVVPAAARLTNW